MLKLKLYILTHKFGYELTTITVKYSDSVNILKFGLECLKKDGWEFHINIFNNNKTKHNMFQNNEGISKRVPLKNHSTQQPSD